MARDLSPEAARVAELASATAAGFRALLGQVFEGGENCNVMVLMTTAPDSGDVTIGSTTLAHNLPEARQAMITALERAYAKVLSQPPDLAIEDLRGG